MTFPIWKTYNIPFRGWISVGCFSGKIYTYYVPNGKAIRIIAAHFSHPGKKKFSMTMLETRIDYFIVALHLLNPSFPRQQRQVRRLKVLLNLHTRWLLISTWPKFVLGLFFGENHIGRFQMLQPFSRVDLRRSLSR